MKRPETPVSHGDLTVLRQGIVDDLQNGRILVPNTSQQNLVFAGGVNHCPNSDISYSEMAATVAGTLPATAGDTNHEAWRIFRQKRTDNLVFDATKALKASGHSLYAANEGAEPYKPRWNRVGGWIELGSVTGPDQYDIAVRLLSKLVKQSETWFFLFRCGALTADIVPADVQFYVGLWQKSGAGEGYAQGSNFVIQHQIVGPQGARSVEYRVLAKTDSGVSMLSAVLAFANAPAVLSDNNYITIFFLSGANSGLIEFQIFSRDVATDTYRKVGTIRNTVDFLYHDMGQGQPATGWPSAGSTPLAYAATRNLKVGAFGGEWEENQLSFRVPSTYDFAATNPDGQALRFGLTAPPGVDRHIGIDFLFFSTTLSKWAPDVMAPFADLTRPTPSIAPTSGNQGTSGGLGSPPRPGSGGPTCIVTNQPVLTRARTRGRGYLFRTFRSTNTSDVLKGDKRQPYQILRKRTGTAAGIYVVITENGIRAECNARHEWFTDIATRKTIMAEQIKAGETMLSSWVRGRKMQTLVVSCDYIPGTVAVGTYVLRDPEGELPDGHGAYVTGWSDRMDRGLFASNIKFLPL